MCAPQGARPAFKAPIRAGEPLMSRGCSASGVEIPNADTRRQRAEGSGSFQRTPGRPHWRSRRRGGARGSIRPGSPEQPRGLGSPVLWSAHSDLPSPRHRGPGPCPILTTLSSRPPGQSGCVTGPLPAGHRATWPVPNQGSLPPQLPHWPSGQGARPIAPKPTDRPQEHTDGPSPSPH